VKDNARRQAMLQWHWTHCRVINLRGIWKFGNPKVPKQLRIEHLVTWNQDFAHSLSLFSGVVKYQIAETGYVRSLDDGKITVFQFLGHTSWVNMHWGKYMYS